MATRVKVGKPKIHGTKVKVGKPTIHRGENPGKKAGKKMASAVDKLLKR